MIKIINYKKSTKNFAETIATHIFDDNDPVYEKCAVYSQVPVNCIYKLEKGDKFSIFPKNLREKTGSMRIDAVLCINDEIALCITKKSNHRFTPILKENLNDLIFTEYPIPQFNEALIVYAKTTLRRHLAKKSSNSAVYKISSFPVSKLNENSFKGIEENEEALIEKLICTRVIDKNSNITDFGVKCGIMACYTKSSSKLREFDVSFKAVEGSSEFFNASEYFKAELSDSPQLLPLERRIYCSKLGIPCEIQYVKVFADKLKTFLNTPLKDIFKIKKSLLNELYDDIKQADDFISKSYFSYNKSFEKIVTYGDIVNFLYFMGSIINCEDDDNEFLEIYFNNIIIDLGTFAENYLSYKKYCFSNSLSNDVLHCLKERLETLKGDDNLTGDILSMPLGFYYYTAAYLADSNYPNWLCMENLLKALHHDTKCCNYEILYKNLMQTISDERAYLFRNPNSNNQCNDDYISLIYKLLVLPLVYITKSTY